MALSEREQQILDDIAANLAEEDPELTKIAATTHADYTRRQRIIAFALIVIGVLFMLGIAIEWWLAIIGATLIFTGMFRLLRTTKAPLAGRLHASGNR